MLKRVGTHIAVAEEVVELDTELLFAHEESHDDIVVVTCNDAVAEPCFFQCIVHCVAVLVCKVTEAECHTVLTVVVIVLCQCTVYHVGAAACHTVQVAH